MLICDVSLIAILSCVCSGATSSDYECCTDVISKQTGACHDSGADAAVGLMQSAVRVTCSDMMSSETDAEGIAIPVT